MTDPWAVVETESDAHPSEAPPAEDDIISEHGCPSESDAEGDLRLRPATMDSEVHPPSSFFWVRMVARSSLAGAGGLAAEATIDCDEEHASRRDLRRRHHGGLQLQGLAFARCPKHIPLERFN